MGELPTFIITVPHVRTMERDLCDDNAVTRHLPGGTAAPRWIIFLFAAILTYEFLHWIEHIVQLYQRAWIGIPTQEASGALSFFDAEWNHFLFNVLTFVVLLVLAHSFYRQRGLPRWSFLTAAAVQTFHVTEHVAKLTQHVLYDCQSCPGIFGNYFDVVYYHFTFNTLVFFLLLYPFFAWGFHRRIWKYA